MALGGGGHRRCRPKSLLISFAFLWLAVSSSSSVFKFVSCMLTISPFVTIGHSHLSSNGGSYLTPIFSVEIRRRLHAGCGFSTVSSLHRSKLHQHDLTGLFPVEDLVCVRRSKSKPHISDLSEDLSVTILEVTYRRRIISPTEVLQSDLLSKESVGKNIYGGKLLVSDSLLQSDIKSSMSSLRRKCTLMYFKRGLLFGIVPVCVVYGFSMMIWEILPQANGQHQSSFVRALSYLELTKFSSVLHTSRYGQYWQMSSLIDIKKIA